jgi:hypothetical protein
VSTGLGKEDCYRPLPMTNREAIQLWPELCEQGQGRNTCLEDLAGSKQWDDTALSWKIVKRNV